MARARSLVIACGWVWFGCAFFCEGVRAESREGDPRAYDLRISVSPVAFQAALSQGWFGSAARIEYEVEHSMDIAVRGRMGWWNATGEHRTRSYAGELTLSIHVSDDIENESLAGTVYPEDPPAVQGVEPGTDEDLIGVPISERMQSGPMTLGDNHMAQDAAMRSVQCMRVGLGVLQVVERALPGIGHTVSDRLAMGHIGYSIGKQWNLPSAVTGKHEVGWRRLYLDALATTASFTRARPAFAPGNLPLRFTPLGARAGIEGSLASLFPDAPGVGLSYQLELGAYPGKAGLEGFLFVGLGIALDAITR